MKVAFRSSYFGPRGTEVALFDYARESRIQLGLEPVILLPPRSANEVTGLRDRFEGEFECHPCAIPEDLDPLLKQLKVSAIYFIKNGFWDQWVSRIVPTWIHAVFPEVQVHGDKYAFVSEWLSEVWGYGEVPYVPHIIRPFVGEGNLRAELGIPKDAVVFGRHGGWESFDRISAQEAVRVVAKKHPEIHFLFLNTADFLHHRHPNVHFLPASTDRARVGQFIHTCDAMIHGRSRGETFGMAVAESAICGKPVFTWRHSPERNHLRWIWDEAWLYSETEELAEKLIHFQKGESMDCSFVGEFSPVRVMEKFRKVFLS